MAHQEDATPEGASAERYLQQLGNEVKVFLAPLLSDHQYYSDEKGFHRAAIMEQASRRPDWQSFLSTAMDICGGRPLQTAANAREDLAEARKNIQKLNAMIEDYKDRERKTKQDRENLDLQKQRLDKREEELGDVDDLEEGLRNKIKTLEEEKKGLQLKFATAKQNHGRLTTGDEKYIQQLESDNEEKNEEIARLNHKTANLEAKMAVDKSGIEQLEKDIGNLQNQQHILERKLQQAEWGLAESTKLYKEFRDMVWLKRLGRLPDDSDGAEEPNSALDAGLDPSAPWAGSAASSEARLQDMHEQWMMAHQGGADEQPGTRTPVLSLAERSRSPSQTSMHTRTTNEFDSGHREDMGNSEHSESQQGRHVGEDLSPVVLRLNLEKARLQGELDRLKSDKRDLENRLKEAQGQRYGDIGPATGADEFMEDPITDRFVQGVSRLPEVLNRNHANAQGQANQIRDDGDEQHQKAMRRSNALAQQSRQRLQLSELLSCLWKLQGEAAKQQGRANLLRGRTKESAQDDVKAPGYDLDRAIQERKEADAVAGAQPLLQEGREAIQELQAYIGKLVKSDEELDRTLRKADLDGRDLSDQDLEAGLQTLSTYANAPDEPDEEAAEAYHSTMKHANRLAERADKHITSARQYMDPHLEGGDAGSSGGEVITSAGPWEPHRTVVESRTNLLLSAALGVGIFVFFAGWWLQMGRYRVWREGNEVSRALYMDTHPKEWQLVPDPRYLLLFSPGLL